MTRWWWAVPTVLIAAGCGSGGSPHATATTGTPATTTPSTAPPSTTASTPTVNYGAQYLAIITPLNNAMDKLPTKPTQAELDNLARIVEQGEAKLLAVRWPGQAESDVHSLVTAMGQAAAALHNDSESQLNTASEAVASASAIVRADLGLPSNLG